MTDAEGSLVVFTPSGKRGRIADGVNLLDAARSLGVDLDSVCGGRGICGRCQVVVAEGEFAKHGITSRADHLTAFSEPETRFRERSGLAADRRLGCHARVCGDLAVDVPPESQLHRQVVRKEADAHPIEIDPVVRLHYVEVREPDLADPSGDLQRLFEALERDWELSGLAADPHVLASLQRTLRAGDWKVTVAVHDGSTITAVWPGFHDVALGVAFDVGSTTVAGHLCDLHTGEVLASAGAMNPQIRFGEDLMSRVSYVMMHPGSERELTEAIRTCVDALIAELCARTGVDASDVLELTVVGNPIMHHLFLGFDPTELGGAPFALVTDESVQRTAHALELHATNAGARVYVLPCIAGHVGADAAGVILSEAPYDQETVNLIVDVGTNAEIVLGNRDRLLAASSPTGPAFEGAQISCGQRAAPGAIERVRIDRESLEPRFRVIGDERWSDEPGFDITMVTGVAGSGIIEAIAEMFLAGVITADGVIDGSLASRTSRVVPDDRTFSYVLHEGAGALRLVITQNDVRQIQLAKGALYAGCRLLMDALGVETVDRIRLAGAFGAHIDPVHAMVLGLVPDCDPEQVTSAGDAAGTGARIALLNRSAREEIEGVVRRVEKLETAVEPRFQEHFVGAMGIPHATDAFPRLAAAVDLPGVTGLHARRPSATPSPCHRTREEQLMSEETAAPKRRRTGGREGRAAARLATVAEKVPFITRTLTPFEVLSEEGLATIEHNADSILEQVGIDFREAPDAIELLKEAGCDVEGERVRFPRGLARQLVQATAPKEFDQVARNPANTVHLGGAATVLAPAYGSPFVRDLDGGRRYGTIEDFRNFVKLAYSTPYLHHSGGTVCEPVDLPVNKRHYDMVYAHMRYSDKAFMGSVTHPQRAQDTVEMARILFGADALEAQPHVLSLINANSPLVWDTIMLGAAKAYAEANQAVIMTPFILAGAMSPATAAGAATQTLAEALAGMSYVQLVRPGAPVVFGSFASSMSMQSGAPTFGTPEPALVLYALAACARRLGVPFRSGGSLTASKVADAQAAYESANTLQPTVLAGVNFVLHAAGWLEGGLAIGYEKFVLDLDQCGQVHEFVKGMDLSPNGQAIDAIIENGPGQHFLGTAHTLANFETAFYRSEIADNNSFEQWELEGSLDAAMRANAIWKHTLAEYEPPPIDEAKDEELREWIEQKKASFPDSNV